MTLRHNGLGRSYATCDSCDANVIDLPLDLEACQRIVRAFFRWTALPDARHACPECAKRETRKRSTRQEIPA